jgi:hypothetical protein
MFIFNYSCTNDSNENEGVKDGWHKEDLGDGTYLVFYTKNEKIEGISKLYTKDGILIEEGENRNGLANGYCKRFFPNGKIERIFYLRNHKAVGPEIIFNEDGEISEKGHRINGQLEGLYYEYYPTGKIKSIQNFYKQEEFRRIDYNIDGSIDNSSTELIFFELPDTLNKNTKLTSKITLMNCTTCSDFKFKLEALGDTIFRNEVVLYNSINDTLINFSVQPPKAGENFIEGVFEYKHMLGDTTLTAEIPFRRFFYVK